MIAKKRLRVLVTGAGAPGTSGTLFSLNLGASSEGVFLEHFATDMDTSRAQNFGFKEILPSPAPEEPNYFESIREIVESKRIDLVVPQTTRESLVLSKYLKGSSELSALVQDPDVISTANDKYEVSCVFRQLGFPTAKFALANSIEELERTAVEMGYPSEDIMVKIRGSSGGRGVRLITSRHETYEEFAKLKPSGMRMSLPDLLKTLSDAPVFPSLLVTEKILGGEITVDVYSGRSGFVAIPRHRNLVRGGISMVTSLFSDANLANMVRKASDEIGLVGTFGFQFMRRNDEWCVIECNPRIQGSMAASVLSGNNVIWLAARDALDFKTQLQLRETWPTGTFRRHWGGELISNDAILRF